MLSKLITTSHEWQQMDALDLDNLHTPNLIPAVRRTIKQSIKQRGKMREKGFRSVKHIK